MRRRLSERRRTILFFCLTAFSAVGGCASSSRLSGPYDGISAGIERGEPSFDVRVRPQIDGGTRGLVVDVAAPELSISFREQNDSLHAQLEWLIRIYDRDGKHVLDEASGRTGISRSTEIKGSLFRYVRHSVFFPVRAGRYVVEIFLEDLLSGKTARRRLFVEFPVRDRPLAVSDISLDHMTGTPILSTQVPFSDQSFSSVYFLTGNTTRPVRSEIAILELVTDTTAAKTPFWKGPNPVRQFSIFQPAVRDTLSSSVTTVNRGPLQAMRTVLRVDKPGLYRIEIKIDDFTLEGAPPAVERTRYIVFRRASFPEIDTYSELIPPLFYLADADEWENLRNAITTTGARQAFDAFWGRYMASQQLAMLTVRSYFSRVEEANLRFSAIREGWKTDRGMVYIILGEPLFIDRSNKRETWYYSFDDDRPDVSFTFIGNSRSSLPGLLRPIQLDRNSEYEVFWRTEIQRWRSGRASS